MPMMPSSTKVFKIVLYAIGIALDASGVFIAIAFPEYGPQLGGVALILIGVYVMRLAKRLETVNAPSISSVNGNSAENKMPKPYVWILFVIALAIILSSISVGIFGALRGINRMLLISYGGFAIGVILIMVVVDRFRMAVGLNLNLSKVIILTRYKRIATVVEISSVAVCVLAFLAWRHNIFNADSIGWPIYVTAICLVLFLTASGYKFYLSLRNLWPRQ